MCEGEVGWEIATNMVIYLSVVLPIKSYILNNFLIPMAIYKQHKSVSWSLRDDVHVVCQVSVCSQHVYQPFPLIFSKSIMLSQMRSLQVLPNVELYLIRLCQVLPNVELYLIRLCQVLPNVELYLTRLCQVLPNVELYLIRLCQVVHVGVHV